MQQPLGERAEDGGGVDVQARGWGVVPPVVEIVGGEAGPVCLVGEHLGDGTAVVEVDASLEVGADGAPGYLDDAGVVVAGRGGSGVLVAFGDGGGHRGLPSDGW